MIYVTVFLQLETVAAAGLFRYNRGQDHKFGGASMTVLNKEMKENRRVELTIRVERQEW